MKPEKVTTYYTKGQQTTAKWNKYNKKTYY